MFYEQNNIAAFKQIFNEQYEFAVKNFFKPNLWSDISSIKDIGWSYYLLVTTNHMTNRIEYKRE